MKNHIEIVGFMFRKDVMRVALPVALLVGSLLFAINHGLALLSGSMSIQRWVSAALSYVVPFVVNAHGQFAAREKFSVSGEAGGGK